MSINIKTTNISSGSAAEAYLIKKLDSLEKFVNFDADNVVAQAEIGRTSNHHKSGEIFRAEINVRIGKATFRVTAEKDDLHAAIDEMKDELAREIKAHKDKEMTNLRKGGAKIKNIVRNPHDE